MPSVRGAIVRHGQIGRPKVTQAQRELRAALKALATAEAWGPSLDNRWVDNTRAGLRRRVRTLQAQVAEERFVRLFGRRP